MAESNNNQNIKPTLQSEYYINIPAYVIFTIITCG
jgi:hypothetical protein